MSPSGPDAARQPPDPDAGERRPSPNSGAVVANLDVEAELCGERLPRRVLDRLSAAGTLLRVLARPGEPLWTPRAVAPQRVPAVAGLVTPTLISGPAARPARADTRVTWCPPAAGRFLSRAIDHRITSELDCLLPGACVLDSPQALERALARNDHGLTERWVLKPLFSAAGRGLLRGRGTRLDDGSEVRVASAVGRLFERDSGALLEPWVDRVDDFGCVGEVPPDAAIRIVGVHRILVDVAGRFGGIELCADGSAHPALAADAAERLQDVARRVGEWLAEHGFEGPFGVDSYRYRAADGTIALHPLGEVNPRFSFGRIARALVDATASHRDGRAGELLRLRFGRRDARGKAMALLRADPAGGDDTCAWLERAEERD